jgi:ABC-type nitrate/sulfonate/bicarbonate transport system substrate-binding protein
MNHTHRTRAFGGAIAIASLLVLAGCSTAAAPENTEDGSDPNLEEVPSLTVAVGAPTLNHSQMFIAEGASLFEKHGVDVEVAGYTAATTMASSLAAGQLDIGVTGLGLLLPALEQSVPIKLVYGESELNYQSIAVISSTRVESLEDLQDLGEECVIAGTVPSTPQGITENLIESYDLECTVTVQAGIEDAAKLVATGQADMAVVLPPTAVELSERGEVNVIYDPATATEEEGERLFPEPLLSSTVFATDAALTDKAESVKRFLAALEEAREMIATESPEELAIITANVTDAFGSTSPESLESQWALLKASILDGFVSEERWYDTLTAMRDVFGSPVANPDSPKQSYDNVDMGPLESLQ